VSSTTRSALVHREVLLPSAAVWVVSLAVAASLGLTVLRVIGELAALAVAVLAVGAVVAAFLTTSPRVEVADGRLSAGRASIPVALLGRVREVDAAQLRELLGPRSDTRAYVCQRGWVHQGVVVEVVDPQDPTPYWVVASRRPARLAAAIEAARATTAGDEPSG
jgi:hypothetical protein